MERMERHEHTGRYTDNGYHMRCIRHLLEQIGKDYARCNRLWERLEKGSADYSEIEEVMETIAWLKIGLRTYRTLTAGKSEGVSWSRMTEIEKTVTVREHVLQQLLFPIPV